jgi:hypothetical protein
MKKYPFEEGDDYWTIQDEQVVWSCWDDISEELYSKNKLYFTSQEKAEEFLNNLKLEK